jgi:photosynthetic reaction center H subunit
MTMDTGAITSYFDVAQLAIYAFWLFFFGLCYYLVVENHREGYPMDTDTPPVLGWPVPQPKTYLLRDGSQVVVPRGDAEPPSTAQLEPIWREVDGAIAPVGNPLLAGVGPGSWSLREDHPDADYAGVVKIRPLRVLEGYGVSERDPDPRGMTVHDAHGEPVGKVVDLWIDMPDAMFRYFEVELAVDGGTRRVLLPVNFARVKKDRVNVHALLASQWADIPVTKDPTMVTMREEERIQAYFGAGLLYAEPSRAEPLI